MLQHGLTYVQWEDRNGRKTFRAYRSTQAAVRFVSERLLDLVDPGTINIGGKQLKYNAHRDWRGA